MRVLLFSLVAAAALSGCTTSVQHWLDSIPPCPGPYTHWEESPDYTGAEEVENVAEAFRQQGWSNITVRREGAGGFGSPDHVTVVAADCIREDA